jgi:hypothetical protein
MIFPLSPGVTHARTLRPACARFVRRVNASQRADRLQLLPEPLALDERVLPDPLALDERVLPVRSRSTNAFFRIRWRATSASGSNAQYGGVGDVSLRSAVS